MKQVIELDECGVGACEPDQHQPHFRCCDESTFIYAEYGGRGLTVLRCAACKREIGDYKQTRKPGEQIHWYG